MVHFKFYGLKIILLFMDGADLIMLSMSSKQSNIYLLREALMFNKVIPNKFLLRY